MASEDHFDAWWREALCAQVGSSLFFLNAGEPGIEAKRTCRLCPVRAKCLADSVMSDVEHGIFGGFGRPVRRALRVRVDQGEDPMTVAEQAIQREKKARPRHTWRT